jgi:hypothetical protein
MGKVYITGVGERPVLHAHGAWNHCAGYTAIEDSLCHPVPYLLVGGPNKQGNDSLSPYPGRCYEDIADPAYYYLGNYTLNETAVNIQAALIVLAGYFSTGGAGAGIEPHRRAGRTGLNLSCPNPVGSEAWLRFTLSEPQHVRLSVYDIQGRLVAGIVDGPLSDGVHSACWDVRGGDGNPAASGVYLAVLATRSRVVAHKLVLIR